MWFKKKTESAIFFLSIIPLSVWYLGLMKKMFQFKLPTNNVLILNTDTIFLRSWMKFIFIANDIYIYHDYLGLQIGR